MADAKAGNKPNDAPKNEKGSKQAEAPKKGSKPTTRKIGKFKVTTR